MVSFLYHTQYFAFSLIKETPEYVRTAIGPQRQAIIIQEYATIHAANEHRPVLMGALRKRSAATHEVPSGISMPCTRTNVRFAVRKHVED